MEKLTRRKTRTPAAREHEQRRSATWRGDRIATLVLPCLLAAASAPAQESRRDSFQAALNWVYVIQNLEAEMFGALRDLSVDVVVVDAVSLLNDENRPAVSPADEIAALKATAGFSLPRRLVLAYVDIGQAEEHRLYWQDHWQPGSPDWIAGLDPDGWEGNFPVAYWRPEWRAIVRSAVEQVVRDGHDGIYMDWVEAYSDPAVVALAEAEGIIAPDAMVALIEDIGTWGRALDPDFLVVSQNAAELMDEAPRFLEVIDGLAQEQLHYDGSPDPDGAPGDCPLPRTDAEIGTPEFLATLPDPSCAELSTLQVSTEWYLSFLRPIRDRGIKMMVVDYAVVPENVADAFARSAAEGFTPYAADRQLDAIGTVYYPR